jgi:hypothetical protein
MTITSTKLPTFGTGMIEGKLADPRFAGEVKIAQAQAAASASTVYGSGREGGSGEIIPPTQSTIDYRPNVKKVRVTLSDNELIVEMNAHNVKPIFIGTLREWQASYRLKNAPQSLRKAVNDYIMAATGKPSGKKAKVAPQTTSVAAGGTGGPKKPDDDEKTKKTDTAQETFRKLREKLGQFKARLKVVTDEINLIKRGNQDAKAINRASSIKP